MIEFTSRPPGLPGPQDALPPPLPTYAAPRPVFQQSVVHGYHVQIHGVVQGPYPLEHVRHLARTRQVLPTTPVSYAGQAWVPATSAPGIFSDKSYVTAVLLSLFLGTFGIDRFYLGQNGLGVAKLLLSWLTGGIWQLIDLILIAVRKVPDAQGRPLR